MTREEAIERLEQNKAAAEFYAVMTTSRQATENELKDIEALNMAVEALTEKPYCTLASRRCFAQGHEIAWCLTCPHISEEDRALIKEVLTEPNWIPCNQNLPNESDWYLVTLQDIESGTLVVDRIWFAHSDDYIGSSEWREYDSDLDDVIAWMPAPDPWKGESCE